MLLAMVWYMTFAVGCMSVGAAALYAESKTHLTGAVGFFAALATIIAVGGFFGFVVARSDMRAVVTNVVDGMEWAAGLLC